MKHAILFTLLASLLAVMPILMVALQSDKRSLLELSEIADLTVKEQLQTISDVSSVSIWGEKRYSMRLWLDPVKMAGYGITPIDVKNAVSLPVAKVGSGIFTTSAKRVIKRLMDCLLYTSPDIPARNARSLKITRSSAIGAARIESRHRKFTLISIG